MRARTRYVLDPNAIGIRLAESEQTLQTIYTMGADVHYDRYHIPLVRDKLTRNLPAIVPDVIDEVTIAFQEYIPGNTQGS